MSSREYSMPTRGHGVPTHGDVVRAGGAAIQVRLDHYDQVLSSRAARLESLGYAVVPVALAAGPPGDGPPAGRRREGLLDGAPAWLDGALAAGVEYAGRAAKAKASDRG